METTCLRKRKEIRIFGSVGYVGQTPWIMDTSIRSNILLDKPEDKKKLEQALQLTELEFDLKSFDQDIEKNAGENGNNLSGGQRSRVALARLIYHDPDIFLLDNVLSALDLHVADRIFHNCIIEFLIKKKKKTVVLVSHEERLLHEAQSIFLVTENQEILNFSSLTELMAQQKSQVEFLMPSNYENPNMDSVPHEFGMSEEF